MAHGHIFAKNTFLMDSEDIQNASMVQLWSLHLLVYFTWTIFRPEAGLLNWDQIPRVSLDSSVDLARVGEQVPKLNVPKVKSLVFSVLWNNRQSTARQGKKISFFLLPILGSLTEALLIRKERLTRKKINRNSLTCALDIHKKALRDE